MSAFGAIAPYKEKQHKLLLSTGAPPSNSQASSLTAPMFAWVRYKVQKLYVILVYDDLLRYKLMLVSSTYRQTPGKGLQHRGSERAFDGA